jgi:hypothetical protein
MEKIEISEKWFETCSENELNRFVLGYNDGQGDHGFMTWDTMLDMYIDVNVDKGNFPQNLSIEDYIKLIPSRFDVVNSNYEYAVLNGNNSDMIYFDGKYKKVYWVD